MLTIIPNSGKASPKMRFDLNMDFKGCSYSHKVIANPKTKQPLFQELIGIDETNTRFQRLSYNCKFFAGKKPISYKKFMGKTFNNYVLNQTKKMAN